MQITVLDPKFQTLLFGALFLAALLLSTRRVKREEPFPPSLTNDLKGFAILTVVFGHIGYVLSRQTEFLFPLSIMAGVGVNVFLFLSGLGLTLSQEKGGLRPMAFYKHRLTTIMIPLWITLVVFYALDFFWLQKTYPAASVVQSVFGVYPRAVMFEHVNAPLWYLSLILSYYLFFPFLYRKSRPYLSALLVLIVNLLCIAAAFPFVGDTIWLYIIHCNAFPLGMLAAQAVKRLPKRPLSELVPRAFRIPMALVLACAIAYMATHAGLVEWYEQPVSMLMTLSLVALFALLPFRSGLLALFGTYSYEIYLLHWPLLSRHDFLYRTLPSWIATATYLVALIALGWLLHRVSGALVRKKTIKLNGRGL